VGRIDSLPVLHRGILHFAATLAELTIVGTPIEDTGVEGHTQSFYVAGHQSDQLFPPVLLYHIRCEYR